MSWEALRNSVVREVLRALDRRTRRVPVAVDSYNPQLHAVKLKLQPEDTLTGWVPIQPLQTGNGFGFHVAPNVNDHGWLEFHEADRRAGVFVGGTFNDLFQPVEVQAGEWLYKHKSGSSLYFKDDGSVVMTDKGGATATFDGTGTIVVAPAAGKNLYLGGQAGARKVVRDGDSDTGGKTSIATSSNVFAT